ncbi:hypothetical protein CASFOL_033288 [Castilleja foliolosa]|uniref:Uncharacterized protein n=1 Tax=Castilleja foliolosa TaxID=1961234 RepID=A0ABD3BZD4_9LAMI
MARKCDKSKKVGTSKLPPEGVITEEMLDVEVEVPEQVNDNTLNDNPGHPEEVAGNMVVTTNVVVDPP